MNFFENMQAKQNAQFNNILPRQQYRYEKESASVFAGEINEINVEREIGNQLSMEPKMIQTKHSSPKHSAQVHNTKIETPQAIKEKNVFVENQTIPVNSNQDNLIIENNIGIKSDSYKAENKNIDKESPNTEIIINNEYFSTDSKNIQNQHKIPEIKNTSSKEVYLTSNKVNDITITIGKLEIKALKQEKSVVRKTINNPNLTLGQYIKNRSGK
ncbi:MAG: hypothetical protein KA536_15880 [Saprospiraceae bacterium]|nr:hypothetical protein [Saprospiraceae bacterium]